jgi:hypothetical protein
VRTYVRVGLVALCVTAGCLPAGDPPRGQQLLDGRQDTTVQWQPTGAGRPTRLLALQQDTSTPNPGFPGVSVYDLGPVDPATGRAQKTLLFDDALSWAAQGCNQCGYPYDARGRLLLLQGKGDPSRGLFDVHLWRVDPATAARVDVGAASYWALSDDRTLLLYGQGVDFRVRDLDDHETVIRDADKAELVGHDVYLISKDKKLLHLRGTDLDGEPELVEEDVADWQRFDTARGPFFLLSRIAVETFGPSTHALFDPATGKTIPLPGETEPSQSASLSPSPSGRSALIQTFVSSRAPLEMTMFDRDTGDVHTAPLDAGIFSTAWRPGHEEVWLQTDGGVIRWRVGEDPARLKGVEGVVPAMRPSGSFFSPDGASFLSYGPPTSLQSVDDLTAPSLQLTGYGMYLGAYWPVPDGRGVAENYKTYQWHNEISIVDPAAGTNRLLGTGGYVLAVGPHRLLAYLGYVKSTMSGTLTLIDLETGARTDLGQDVHDVALDTPATADDPLAPGTRLAFMVRARIAGPYDGLWLTELP